MDSQKSLQKKFGRKHFAESPPVRPKNTEESSAALDTSEKLYRSLFELSGTANCVLDDKSNFQKVNQQFEELSGFKKEDLENQCNFMMFVHPEDRKTLDRYHHERLNAPKLAPPSYEFRFLDRWGNEKNIHISVSTFSNNRQICALVDLTEIQELEREVRNKEQFLANILRYSIEAIVAIDTEGKIQSWNHGARLIFGFQANEILGKAFDEILAPEFRKSQKLKEIRDAYIRQGFIRGFIAEAQNKDGNPLEIEITRTAILDSSNNNIGSSAIIRDITEKRRHEQRMIQQEKTLALGEMAASLAHEIKNPLNSMVINMEVMKGKMSTLPEQDQKTLGRYLHVLTDEIQRLNKVVGGILDFARPLDGTFAKVDLCETLKRVIELVNAQASRLGTTITTKIPAKMPLVEGIEDQLKQIFLNLLLNAVQAMPDGGHIDVAVKKGPRRTMQVLIKDSGQGIPKSNFSRIFDLYFSTKEKGSGLGLPMVKRLVTNHGGTIQFKSREKLGTTFTLTFPTS